MDSNRLQLHVLKSYYTLRVGMGVLAILLPVLLGVGGLLLGVDSPGSISGYYHTPMRDIFVGILFAAGVFLFLYKGYSKKENYALNLAGVFACAVALLPEAAPENAPCETFTASFAHGVSAVLFFLSVAYVGIWRSKDTLEHVEDDTLRRRCRHTYNVLGALMVILPLVAAALSYLARLPTVIYWVEFAAIWVFGAFWIVKSVEIRRSALDDEALRVPA